MTNNIGGNDPKLNALIDSVRQDTPDLSREELLALITKNEDRPVGAFMRQNNTPSHQRRIVVMSILAAIIFTASYFLIKSGPEDVKSPSSDTSVAAVSSQVEHQPEATSVVDSISVTTKDEPTHLPSIISVDEIPTTRSSASIDPKRWQQFIHKPIDLQAFTPIDITPGQFASLGLLQTDSGEVIYYHKDYKFGFPSFDYIRQINDKDPNKKLLGMRPFYAQYVTDSRGNMMMHYENKSINGGNTVMVGLYDRDLSELLKNIKYYGNSTIRTDEQEADTSKDILKLSVKMKEGIHLVDTILLGKISDQRSIKESEQRIAKLLHVKDSLYKMSLGGMDAIAKDYPFDFSAKNDPLVFIIASRFSDIDKKSSLSELEKISEKIEATSLMMDGWPKVEGKLRLEQLTFKLQYEQYIEQSKLEAAELANPVDLIAVNVRPTTGAKANPKLDNGLIFWYRDSDTLREILDTRVASVRAQSDPKIKMSVMPNPAMLYLYVNYHTEVATPLRITLADITGRSVYTDAWMSSAGSGKKEINVQQIPNGIYMLVLDSEKGRTTRQVIVQHQ
jgi:hypothetical protein